MAMLTITCPQCVQQLQLPDEIAGKLVKCPACKTVFNAGSLPLGETQTAPDPQAITPPGQLSVPLPPPRPYDAYPDSPKRDRYDDDRRRPTERYDDDYDRRDFRRPYREFDDDYDTGPDYHLRRRERDMRVARDCVTPVGIVLMVYGGLIILGTLGILLFAVIASARNSRSDSHIFWLVVSMVSLCFGGFIMFGGYMMKTMRSYGLAMTASIMTLCTSCGLGVFGIGLGVWALIILGKIEVKNAFAWTSSSEN